MDEAEPTQVSKEKGRSSVFQMPEGYSPHLCNEDMAPTPKEQRTWGTMHIAALWVGMSVCVPTYMLAGNLIQQGLNWWESVLVILAGNLVVLFPMILNGHAGTEYGIPFPVLLRTSYGHKGAHVPSVLRALVACGWFAFQTWIGGEALHTVTVNLLPGVWPDVFGAKFAMYILFWLMNVYFVWNGTESIKKLESLAAPMLLGIGVLLLGWGVQKGGGLTAVLDRSYELARAPVVAYQDEDQVRLDFYVLSDAEGRPKAKAFEIQNEAPVAGDAKPSDKFYSTGRREFASSTSISRREIQDAKTLWVRFDSELKDQDGRTSSWVKAPVHAQKPAPGSQGANRWLLYLGGITAMVAFWATLALNIPDITRFAQSQKDQMMGQAIGLPLTMGLYSFIGLAVTCATLNIFPDLVIGSDAIWDPIQLLSRFDSKIAIIVAMVMLAVATLTTNIAANVISPANCFSNAWPEKISFRTGGMMAACLGVMMMPWKLKDYYLTWLITYSGLLGPIMGVMVVDYALIRKRRLDVDALYTEGSSYSYFRGFHLAGIGSTLFGIFVVCLGLWVPSLHYLHTGAWFSGALSAGLVYFLVAKRPD